MSCDLCLEGADFTVSIIVTVDPFSAEEAATKLFNRFKSDVGHFNAFAIQYAQKPNGPAYPIVQAILRDSAISSTLSGDFFEEWMQSALRIPFARHQEFFQQENKELKDEKTSEFFNRTENDEFKIQLTTFLEAGFGRGKVTIQQLQNWVIDACRVAHLPIVQLLHHDIPNPKAAVKSRLRKIVDSKYVSDDAPMLKLIDINACHTSGHSALTALVDGMLIPSQKQQAQEIRQDGEEILNLILQRQDLRILNARTTYEGKFTAEWSVLGNLCFLLFSNSIDEQIKNQIFSFVTRMLSDPRIDVNDAIIFPHHYCGSTRVGVLQLICRGMTISEWCHSCGDQFNYNDYDFSGQQEFRIKISNLFVQNKHLYSKLSSGTADMVLSQPSKMIDDENFPLIRLLSVASNSCLESTMVSALENPLYPVTPEILEARLNEIPSVKAYFVAEFIGKVSSILQNKHHPNFAVIVFSVFPISLIMEFMKHDEHREVISKLSENNPKETSKLCDRIISALRDWSTDPEISQNPNLHKTNIKNIFSYLPEALFHQILCRDPKSIKIIINSLNRLHEKVDEKRKLPDKTIYTVLRKYSLDLVRKIWLCSDGSEKVMDICHEIRKEICKEQNDAICNKSWNSHSTASMPISTNLGIPIRMPQVELEQLESHKINKIEFGTKPITAR